MRADGFMKMFPKWPRTLMEGMELRLCFVMSLLPWTLVHFFVSGSFMGKVLDLNTNLFYLGNGRGVCVLLGGQYLLVFRFCPIAGLQCSTVNLKVVSSASFLTTSWRSLKEGPNKLLTTRFCSKHSSIKCFTQTHESFEGMKHSLFIFISHSLLSFGFWRNLKVLTFEFKWFSSEVRCELETKTVSNFPHLLSSLTVTSQVLFLTMIRQFFTLWLWRIKNSDFNIPISPQCFVQFFGNFRIRLFYT